MKSLSSLGIGLSLVFSCLLLALIAELYYLLWWKKRGTNSEEIQDDYSSSSSAREFLYLFCWKKPSSLSSTGLNPQELICNGNEQDTQVQLHSHSSKELFLNPFGGDSMEAELMRLHNLAGPPRLLFTINEETKEDLESDDGRSRVADKNRKVSRSLADLLLAVETPFLTPMSSPRLTTSTPPMTPIMDSLNSQHGFNPLFESSVDPEMFKRRASPPPKFKFLKDAEEKLYKRRLIEEAMKRVQRNTTSIEDHDRIKASPTSSMVTNEEDGSFIRIIVDNNNKESTQIDHPHHHSCSSQILPLSSSPSSIRTTNRSPKD